MGILTNPIGTLTATMSEFAAPLKGIFGSIPEYNGPDFPEGFVIQELLADGEDGVELSLVGKMMPHQPFTWGGSQQLVKEYYPGNPEPTVQVLGGREDNLKITGRFFAKHYPDEEFREIPMQMAEAIDALRKRGSLVRLTLGEWQRWGFIERCSFPMKTLADTDYEIEFFIIGDKPPSECKMVEAGFELPLDLNMSLINAAVELEALQLEPFDGMDQSLFTELNELLGTVATALSVVTKFVDSTLAVAENVQKFANRAVGLIKYAKATISTFKRRVGQLQAYAGSNPEDEAVTTWNETKNLLQAKHVLKVQNATSKPIVISDAQKAEASAGVTKFSKTASTQQQALAQTGGKSIDQLLQQMQKKFEKLAIYAPLARHLTKANDTLQTISARYYKTPDNWKKIYDHNKLQTTVLVVGKVLEIPRL